MNNSDKPAMPYIPTNPWSDEAANGFGGLTKREYFSGLAMQGITSNPSDADLTSDYVLENLGLPKGTKYSFEKHYSMYVAKKAVKFADALLTELEK